MEPNDVTLVKDAIHNPDEPRHFMTITPLDRQVYATVAGFEIARTDAAVVVKEVGHQIYDPMIYFPREGVQMELLQKIDHTTHCPIKGDTEYFDITTPGSTLNAAAWSYTDMALGDELQGLVAFDPSVVEIV